MFLINFLFISLILVLISDDLAASTSQDFIHINEDIKNRVESIRTYLKSEDYENKKTLSEILVKKTLIDQRIINVNDQNLNPRVGQEKTKNGDGLSSDRLYIFISSSMPKNVIRSYVREAAKIDNSVIVMRGFINGAHQVKPTVVFISEILKQDPHCDHANCAMQPVAFEIDPLKFQNYGVTQVPTVIYEQNAIDGYCLESQVVEQNQNPQQSVESLNKVVGQSTLHYALETLLKHPSTSGLVKIADHLQPTPWESL